MTARLSTLGSTHLDTGSRLPPGLAAGRPLLLLVYLSCEPRAQTRAHLIDLLWGDRTERTGRRALNQALYVMGEGVADDLVGKHHELVWLENPPSLDVHAFDQAVKTADLDALLALYRGGFLADLEPDWPVEFDYWVEGLRRQLEDRFRDTLLAIAEGAADAANPARVDRALVGLKRVATFDVPSFLQQLRVARRAGLSEHVVDLVHRMRQEYVGLGIDIDPATEVELNNALSEARRRSAEHVRDRQQRAAAPGVASGPSSETRPVRSRSSTRMLALASHSSAVRRIAAVVLLGSAYMGVRHILSTDAHPQLAPLPTGLLVDYEEDGGRRFAVIDPVQPDLRTVIPSGELTENQYDSELLLLSPDHSKIATTLTRNGSASDVYVIGRSGRDTTRVSSYPDDDRPLSWFPDDSAVLIKTRRGADVASRTARLAVSRLASEVAFLLENDADESGWEEVTSAAVSPLGTRIAATVQGARAGLWLLDADGTDRIRIGADLGATGNVWWSPDARHLAVTDPVPGGWDVVVVNLDGTERTTAIKGIAAGGAVAWSPDGSRLFAQVRVDGNTEVYSAAADGSDLRRLTHTAVNERVLAYVARRPRYVDHVEILGSGPARSIALAVGDSSDIGAALKDTADQSIDDTEVEWTCSRPEVCTVRNGWLVSLGAGSSLLVADAGGWRADTLRVQVADADQPPRLIFREGWEEGIDSGRWKAFGRPGPIVVDGSGRNGSRGLRANGDMKWESGLITRDALDYSRGLTVDVWGTGVFRPRDAPWQYFIAGVTQQPMDRFEGEAERVEPIVGVVVAGDRTDVPVRMEFLGFTSEDFVDWDPEEWHRYTVQLHPSGDAELWIDGRFWWRAAAAVEGDRRVRVVMEGRSFDWPVIHDDLGVYEGFLFHNRR